MVPKVPMGIVCNESERARAVQCCKFIAIYRSKHVYIFLLYSNKYIFAINLQHWCGRLSERGLSGISLDLTGIVCDDDADKVRIRMVRSRNAT